MFLAKYPHLKKTHSKPWSGFSRRQSSPLDAVNEEQQIIVADDNCILAPQKRKFEKKSVSAKVS